MENTHDRSIEFIGPPRGRPFSTAVRLGDVLYLSGQIGVRGDGWLPEGFRAQVCQTLENIAASLEAVGFGLERVFKATIMLEDMGRWAEFNEIYLEYFSDPARLPARSAFGASGLALGAAVEIECWAHVG